MKYLLLVFLVACSPPDPTSSPDGGQYTPRPSAYATDFVGKAVGQIASTQTINTPYASNSAVRVWAGWRATSNTNVVVYQEVSTSNCTVIGLSAVGTLLTGTATITGSSAADFMEVVEWADGPGGGTWPSCANISNPVLTKPHEGFNATVDVIKLYGLGGFDLMNIGSGNGGLNRNAGFGGDDGDRLWCYGSNSQCYGEAGGDVIWHQVISSPSNGAVMSGGTGDDCLTLEGTNQGNSLMQYTCDAGNDNVELGDGNYLTDGSCEGGVTACP